jgi:hypothetical protein
MKKTGALKEEVFEPRMTRIYANERREEVFDHGFHGYTRIRLGLWVNWFLEPLMARIYANEEGRSFYPQLERGGHGRNGGFQFFGRMHRMATDAMWLVEVQVLSFWVSGLFNNSLIICVYRRPSAVQFFSLG